jgi:hypothetical protein
MDLEDIKELYDNKYEKLLGVSFEQWSETSPQTEGEAYARLQVIDEERKRTEDEYNDAVGREREELQDYRTRLLDEYELIEEVWGLESNDSDY